MGSRGERSSQCKDSDFWQLICKDSSVLFAKRLANSQANGSPPPHMLEREPFSYVIGVLNAAYSVRSAVDQGFSLSAQALTPPPDSWLDEIDLSLDQFRQQVLDLFTVVLHSTLDRVLLLVNTVYEFALEPKQCTLKNIRSRVGRDCHLSEELGTLKAAIECLSDARHSFVHRGERRDIGAFTFIARARACVKAFGDHSDRVKIDDAPAVKNIAATLRSDINSIDIAAAGAMNLLVAPYSVKLNSLGGLPLFTAEEAKRAAMVIAYLGGEGEKPDFMRDNS